MLILTDTSSRSSDSVSGSRGDVVVGAVGGDGGASGGVRGSSGAAALDASR